MRSIFFLLLYLLLFVILFAVSFYGVMTNQTVFTLNEAFKGTDSLIMILSIVGIGKTVWHIARY